MSLPVYNSKNVVVNFLGYPLDGLAPDSFVEFASSADITDEEVGADGQVSISLSPDQTGSCTVSLQQASTANIFLSGVLAEQRIAGSIAVGSLTVKDPAGAVLAKMSDAHIKTAPTVGLGSSATGSTRDWVIFCQKLEYVSVPEGYDDVGGILADVNASIDNAKRFLL